MRLKTLVHEFCEALVASTSITLVRVAHLVGVLRDLAMNSTVVEAC
jgi:hypothetical protein